jgi:hypothetical protein
MLLRLAEKNGLRIALDVPITTHKELYRVAIKMSTRQQGEGDVGVHE